MLHSETRSRLSATALARRISGLALAALMASALVVSDATVAPAATQAAEGAQAPPAQPASSATLRVTKPKLTGSIRAGGVMTAKVSRPGAVKPTLRYDWFRDGKRIGGASKKTYKLKKKDRGHRIKVRVTASYSGYPNVVKTSKASAKIRPAAIDDPTSGHIVVNKRRGLKPKTYRPSGLVQPRGIQNVNGQPLKKSAARAVERMVKAARKDGVNFRIISGYRSYSYQKSLYNSYVSQHGRTWADKYSARPGHSEHQTGFAVDFGDMNGCGLGTCFEKTKAGRWLAKHAWKYGFILRYPKGYTKITGYAYEPWHYRYVGKNTAKKMKQKKIKTLEQYRKLDAAPNYR